MTQSKDILSEVALIPISSEKPAGENIRYDDEFEFVEDELAKQGSMVDRGLVNWDKVIDACINLLSKKSKDLKVACYLTRALFEKKGIEGLQIGLGINLQIINTFWDDLFPTKARARGNAFEWLMSRLEPLMNDVQPDLKLLEAYKGTYENIQKLESFFNEKLEKDAPALGNFRRSLQEVIDSLSILKEQQDEQQKQQQLLKKNAQEPSQTNINNSDNGQSSVNPSINNNNSQAQTSNVTTTAPETNHSQQTLNVSLIATSPNDEKDKNKIIRQCHEALRNLSAWSLDKNIDSPSAYAMNRFSTWMSITQLPVHTDYLTPLRPLPKDKITAYNNLFNSNNYQELVPLVEQSFSKSPFWLDAHRLSFLSLEAMGMQESANQVKEHLAIFLRRFPELIEMKFSDHSGFANDLTKQWINSVILVTESHQTALSNDGADEEFEHIVEEAKAIVKQKNIKEAIDFFQQKLLSQSVLKNKIFLKYYFAQFCYDNSEKKLAYFLLKEIDRFLQKNNLEYWEPDLEKNVVYLLLLSCGSVNINSFNIKGVNVVSSTTDDEPKKTEENKEYDLLYSRLCQLDPVLALGL